jgi:hypothetical protein
MTRIVLVLLLIGAAQAQERQTLAPATPAAKASEAPPVEPNDGSCIVKSGTRIPLTLMNTISSKNAAPGDQVYLETMMPTVINRRVIIPAGSFVKGTITQSQRPGKVKGRGELYLRFDSLLLKNGVELDLSGRIGSLDGGNPGQLSRDEGKVTSDGSVGKDALIVGGTSLAGTGMGHWIGGHGEGAAIGAGAGAAAGLTAVLLTRGPDAVLERGSMVEMILNRDLQLNEDEIPTDAGGSGAPRVAPSPHAPATHPAQPKVPGLGRRLPLPGF